VARRDGGGQQAVSFFLGGERYLCAKRKDLNMPRVLYPPTSPSESSGTMNAVRRRLWQPTRERQHGAARRRCLQSRAHPRQALVGGGVGCREISSRGAMRSAARQPHPTCGRTAAAGPQFLPPPPTTGSPPPSDHRFSSPPQPQVLFPPPPQVFRVIQGAVALVGACDHADGCATATRLGVACHRLTCGGGG